MSLSGTQGGTSCIELCRSPPEVVLAFDTAHADRAMHGWPSLATVLKCWTCLKKKRSVKFSYILSSAQATDTSNPSWLRYGDMRRLMHTAQVYLQAFTHLMSNQCRFGSRQDKDISNVSRADAQSLLKLKTWLRGRCWLQHSIYILISTRRREDATKRSKTLYVHFI